MHSVAADTASAAIFFHFIVFTSLHNQLIPFAQLVNDWLY